MADNPFVGRANARGEIFAFGFRNPWQIAFDTATGLNEADYALTFCPAAEAA